MDILTNNKLHYSHTSESGVLFHLIGALSEFGKLGVTAIGNSPEEVDEIYRRILNAGKSVQAVSVGADEVVPLLDAVGPKGMYVMTHCETRAQAERLLRDVERFR